MNVKFGITFLVALSSPLVGGQINQREVVARGAKDLLSSIDSFDNFPLSLVSSSVVQSYAHEYGHKIALDRIGIDGDIKLSLYSGRIFFAVNPEQEALLGENHGAGLEMDQMIASYGLENILRKDGGYSDYLALARNHFMTIYHYDRGGDGQKYRKLVGDSHVFKRAMFLQSLNYTAFLEGPVALGYRNHFTEEGIDEYYDLYFQRSGGALGDTLLGSIYFRKGRNSKGMGVTLSYRGLSFGLQKEDDKKVHDGWIRYRQNLPLFSKDFQISVGGGYKEAGIFIGKPRESGLYYSASLKVDF